jgi:hypothetical protein
MDFLADLAGLARHPFPTLARIERSRRLSFGLLALAIAFALPLAAAELAAIHPYHPPAHLGSLPAEGRLLEDVFARWSYQQRFLLPLALALGGVLIWLVAAALIHLIARGLRGRGSFAGYLKLAGYISCLGLVALPFNLLVGSLELRQASSLLFALGVGLFLWQNLLLVFAAQLHYGISGERAVTAVVGPVGCLAVLVVALTAATVVLAVALAGGRL